MKLKLEKTNWSSVVGGGFSITTEDGKRYEAMIIGASNGITKEIDANICVSIMNAVNDKWISDNDFVPDSDRVVMVNRVYGGFWWGKFIKDQGWHVRYGDDWKYVTDVTDWQPLPEPPQ